MDRQDNTMYIVESATEITPENSNMDRCFKTNAVGFPDKESARAEADRRNAVERSAGHTNVIWYPTKW